MPNPNVTPDTEAVAVEAAEPANPSTAFVDAQAALSAIEPPVSEQAPPAESPPAPADPPPSETPAETPPPENPLFEQARGLGIEISEGDTLESVAGKLISQQQAQQPYVEYGRSLLPHAKEINGLLSGDQPELEPAEAPASDEWSPEGYFRDQWKVPEWKPQYDRLIESGFVQRNDRGDYVAAPGHEMIVAPVLADLNEAATAQATQWRDITRGNPYEAFHRVLQEPLRRQWQEDIRAEIQRLSGQQQTQSEMERFEQDNSHWLYGEDGKLTPSGETFADNAREFYEATGDMGKAIALGLKSIGGAPASKQPPASEAPVEGAPESNGHQEESAPSSGQQKQTFLERAREQAAHEASAGNATTDSPDVPTEMSKRDLENLFTNRFKASQGQPAA